jgi:nicotinate-nucleotide adenylyltransferase
MNVAFFGGSFDPVHIGHVEVVNEALKHLDIDKLFITPAYLSPFKAKSYASASLRLKWIKKVFNSNDKVQVVDYETKQEDRTPTIQTITHLKQLYNLEKIYLIIGADNLEKLNKWFKIEELKKQVTFVIAARDDIKIDSKYETLNVNIDTSATNLREHMDSTLLPEVVKEEIEKYYMKEINGQTS